MAKRKRGTGKRGATGGRGKGKGAKLKKAEASVPDRGELLFLSFMFLCACVRACV